MILTNPLLANEKKIAKIPEASGITYSKKNNSLFVVNDEGYIYELSLKGKIIRKKRLGNYDLEGITYDEKKDLLLVINEKKDSILVLKQKNFKKINEIKIKRKFNNIKVLKKGSDGIEAITLYKNKIYVSNQSNKRYPKEDCSVIAIINYNPKKKKQKITNIIDHGFIDVAGLTFYKDMMYFVSDKKNLLVKYHIKKKKVLKKYKLPSKYAQEGITFDDKGNLYIADDNGQIIKMKIDE